ncbi:CHAP domain-containing protein [Formicincola oecophyllae]|uniref:CHAP domain-containing protein n=1 Tax=Formicincola oecophyllae TaxID=2558361 RepID=A0A4Y6UA51_9PROT|nr:CHAP domain-containing protein [Formicincola oecophyllae]
MALKTQLARFVGVGCASALLALGGCAGSTGGYANNMQCAPYVRARTGVDLHGAAASWWWQARGRYQRTNRPVPGSILVLRSSPSMPYGHVALVRSVEGRTLYIDHAHWEPGRIDINVPVADVSPHHDWSRVRVWWAPSGRMGRRSNPVAGFIVP